MTTQQEMLEDAIAKCRRLVGELERDAVEMASRAAGDVENLAEGQRVIAAALAAARRLLVELQGSADAKAK